MSEKIFKPESIIGDKNKSNSKKTIESVQNSESKKRIEQKQTRDFYKTFLIDKERVVKANKDICKVVSSGLSLFYFKNKRPIGLNYKFFNNLHQIVKEDEKEDFKEVKRFFQDNFTNIMRVLEYPYQIKSSLSQEANKTLMDLLKEGENDFLQKLAEKLSELQAYYYKYALEDRLKKQEDKIEDATTFKFYQAILPILKLYKQKDFFHLLNATKKAELKKKLLAERNNLLDILINNKSLLNNFNEEDSRRLKVALKEVVLVENNELKISQYQDLISLLNNNIKRKKRFKRDEINASLSKEEKLDTYKKRINNESLLNLYKKILPFLSKDDYKKAIHLISTTKQDQLEEKLLEHQNYLLGRLSSDESIFYKLSPEDSAKLIDFFNDVIMETEDEDDIRSYQKIINILFKNKKPLTEEEKVENKRRTQTYKNRRQKLKRELRALDDEAKAVGIIWPKKLENVKDFFDRNFPNTEFNNLEEERAVRLEILEELIRRRERFLKGKEKKEIKQGLENLEKREYNNLYDLGLGELEEAAAKSSKKYYDENYSVNYNNYISQLLEKSENIEYLKQKLTTKELEKTLRTRTALLENIDYVTKNPEKSSKKALGNMKSLLVGINKRLKDLIDLKENK